MYPLAKPTRVQQTGSSACPRCSRCCSASYDSCQMPSAPGAAGLTEARVTSARPRPFRAECLDEFLPEEPERNGIEQEHAFASEGDASALGNEMQQFVNIEIGGAHETSARAFQNESEAYHFDSLSRAKTTTRSLSN